MIKILLAITFLSTLLFSSSSSIEKKILSNKKILKKNKSQKELANLRIRLLANQIKKQSNELAKLDKNIKIVNKDINNHKEILSQSRQILSNLSKTSDQLLKERKQNEEEIVSTIIDEFSSSIALNLASEKSLEEMIDSEVYRVLAINSKEEIIRIDSNYSMINLNKRNNEKAIEKTKKYIKTREKKKRTLNSLKKKQTKTIKSLEGKHSAYQKELKKAISKQQNLAKLLGRLNILKKEQLSKEKRARAKEKKRLLALKRQAEKRAQSKLKSKKRKSSTKTASKPKTATQRYTKNVDIDVRVLGSSTKGVKISKYRGKKTIAPLKSYKIIKKFGKYYDPVYKIKLFNESVVLKTNKSKAKVFSVLNGKVVYAKKNSGMLENVVIIQHKGGLHTIYSHLDRISPTLKVGKWIKKGYVVGRVDNTLTFQATKNSAHINPKDLF
ncbi:peptidase M23 [Arcobacter sp. 31_11_sub10_T18]|nr:peptidase M23 [Arcobacter sp. 31_11_sub10_T18]